MTKRELEEELKKTSAGRKFLEEAEPCEDAIRRADAEAIFRNARSKLNPSDYKTADEFNTRYLMLLNAEQLIHMLPSVKPQEPKTGRWIFVDKAHEHAHCSECDYGNVDVLDGRPHNYCPNCGARMIEAQEVRIKNEI